MIKGDDASWLTLTVSSGSFDGTFSLPKCRSLPIKFFVSDVFTSK
jgi:hypothetical protein